MKKEIKRLKDQESLKYSIKIRQVREVRKIGEGTTEYKDKMFLVDIKDNVGAGIGFNVIAGRNYGTNLRKVFKRIQEELHL